MNRIKRSMLFRIMKGLIERYLDHDINQSGAALSYYLLFTLFPMLLFINIMLGILHLPVSDFLNSLQNIVPMEIIEIISEYLDHIRQGNNGNVMALSLFFAIFMPMRAINFTVVLINKAYGICEERTWIKQYAIVIIFTLFMIISIFMTMGIMVMSKSFLYFISGFFEIAAPEIELWGSLRFVLLGAIIFVVFFLLYYFAPSCKIMYSEAVPGALFVVVAWVVGSLIFYYYVENMSRYSVIYGAIAAIIILLVWLYIMGMIIILGAEINCVLRDIRNENKSLK